MTSHMCAPNHTAHARQPQGLSDSPDTGHRHRAGTGMKTPGSKTKLLAKTVRGFVARRGHSSNVKDASERAPST